MPRELITNSRMAAQLACPRLHQISYVRGYRPVEAGHAIDFGTLGHGAQEHYWNAHKEERPHEALDRAVGFLQTSDAADLDKVKLKVLMIGYDLRWSAAMKDFKILFVEKEFRYPAIDAAGNDLGYDLAGKIDIGYEQISTGRMLLGDHKFTSADFGPGSDYLQKLRLDTQISQYFRGARALGYEPVGFLYDMIRRPDLKLYRATKDIKYRQDGKPYANQRLADETLEEFEQRLTELIAASPNDFFARQEVVRLPEELAAFDDDVRAVAADCVRAVDPFHHAPRNPGACHRFGRPCSFLPVCGGYGSLDDESLYRKAENNGHEELNV